MVNKTPQATWKNTMATKAPKVYTIIKTRRGIAREISGTLEELISYFAYTLECGKSYEHEKGNKKINVKPKSIKSFVANLNNAETNSSANGWSDNSYRLQD